MNDTITRIQGILVGHDSDQEGMTGCTVVLTPDGATAGVDVRGAAPGTRETDLLRPENLVQQVHGVILAGGSAFGLDAAGGVMRWLAEQGSGFDAGIARVPIVPGAVIFDLMEGDAHAWPDAAAGYRACTVASAEPVSPGRVGAGTGATVAKVYGPQGARPGGVGSAVAELPAGGLVGALVVVNALGEIFDPHSGRPLVSGVGGTPPGGWPLPGQNTTLGVVATDIPLSKAQCQRVAQMAHDGLARTIRPSHTMYDGDTIFVLSTGLGPTGDVNGVGILAAEVVAQAIVRAVLPHA